MNLKQYLLVITLLLIGYSSQARHLIGGEITYKCLGNGDYEFVMFMYRDCAGGGAPFDEEAPISIFECGGTSNCNNFRQGDQSFFLRVPLSSQTSVPPPDIECLASTTTPCVEQAIYRFKLSDFGILLPNSNQSYFIVYQRCCRNQTITNIRSPGDAGSTYQVEITPAAQEACNNSALFKEFPPTIICANFDLEFDHAATDEDGDSLVYFFTTPIVGGGPDLSTFGVALCSGASPDPPCPPPFNNVSYTNGYSATRPLGETVKLAQPVSIDPFSGMITGLPIVQGQFVVSVAVAEYRDSVLLNVTTRDFQFNVLSCDAEVSAIITSDTMIGDKLFQSVLCGETQVDFEHESTLEKNIKTVRWEFPLAPGDTLRSTDDRATVDFPSLGNYMGTLFVNPGSKNCADTAQINVSLLPKTEADFVFDYDTCTVGPITFTDQSSTDAVRITNYSWDFGNGDASSQRNPRYQYPDAGDMEVILTVTDNNNCRKSITKDLSYFPLAREVIIGPSSVDDCAPADIFFDNLTEPVNEQYDINWDFGDGNTSTEVSPTHIYQDPGLYTVSLAITSPFGCRNDTVFPALIRVQPSPISDFSFSPEEVTLLDPEVTFRDESEGASGWFWDFHGLGTSIARDPSFTFRDTGMHNIQLIVTHSNGCTDTTLNIVDVIPVVRLFMPNAFTPNDDGKNDLFGPVGIAAGAFDYQFSIWNRWGEQVFFSTNTDDMWDGRKKENGEVLPNGVYIYLVTYTDPRGQEFELKGYATLIK